METYLHEDTEVFNFVNVRVCVCCALVVGMSKTLFVVMRFQSARIVLSPGALSSSMRLHPLAAIPVLLQTSVQSKTVEQTKQMLESSQSKCASKLEDSKCGLEGTD